MGDIPAPTGQPYVSTHNAPLSLGHPRTYGDEAVSPLQVVSSGQLFQATVEDFLACFHPQKALGGLCQSCRALAKVSGRPSSSLVGMRFLRVSARSGLF